MLNDNKRPDGMGKRETHGLGRDSAGHLYRVPHQNTSTTPGAAAHRAAQKKTEQYTRILSICRGDSWCIIIIIIILLFI